MNKFEEKRMIKRRPVVNSKFNEWYKWQEKHVPKPVEGKISKAF